MNNRILKIHEIKQIQEVARFIEHSLEQHYTTEQLARKFKINLPLFKQLFKYQYGMGCHAYLRSKRMDMAKELILQNMPIKQIITLIGYESESNFCKAFRTIFHETPLSWKQKQLTIIDLSGSSLLPQLPCTNKNTNRNIS
jgi:AraC-like DNA-binding protein